MAIDFLSLQGPFVLWFDGEGRDCLLCDTAEQVIDYLMREDGAGWGIHGTREGLIECLNDDDYWSRDEDRKPFKWHCALGEISWANIIVGARRHPTGENQLSISRWADAMFGPAGSNARVAARANEEMSELLRCLTADDDHPKAAEEVADIVIVLYRLASRLGVDLHDEVNRKMGINRGRQWKLDNTGHGYHVREKSPAPVGG